MSPKNAAASVWARLKNLAQQRGEQPEYVLTRYALERLLYRLTKSAHADRFVLKGACLFALWTDKPHRATRDIDFLGHGESDVPKMVAVFKEVCSVAFEEDGLVFQTKTVTGSLIQADQEYEGIRIAMKANLGRAEASVQVDIGFGDVITPAAEEVSYPTLLELPAPVVRAYPKETVVAEKYQAMVQLGIANSRMKDFFDLQVMSKMFALDGETLAAAVKATFQRRRTDVPADAPTALTDAFATDRDKASQWTAFARRLKLGGMTLGEVIGDLRPFLVPVSQAVAEGSPFDQKWAPGGPWR